MFSPNMELLPTLCLTEGNTVSFVSGDHYANYSASRRTSQWHTTPKLTVKWSGSIKSLNSTSESTSTISRTTGCISYCWQSLPTIQQYPAFSHGGHPLLCQ